MKLLYSDLDVVVTGIIVLEGGTFQGENIFHGETLYMIKLIMYTTWLSPFCEMLTSQACKIPNLLKILAMNVYLYFPQCKVKEKEKQNLLTF